MSELLQTYWPLIVAALLLGLVVAWYLFSASRKTRVSGTSGDGTRRTTARQRTRCATDQTAGSVSTTVSTFSSNRAGPASGEAPPLGAPFLGAPPFLGTLP